MGAGILLLQLGGQLLIHGLIIKINYYKIKLVNNTIKASNPEMLFNVRDFQGFGNSVSFGYGGGFVLGASSAVNNFGGSIKDYNLMEAGRYDGGYTTFGVTYGFGKASIGASISRTHTQFINLKK